MASRDQPLTDPQLRTPKAAAIAGIVFAVLLGTSMVLIQLSIPADPPSDPGWLTEDEFQVGLAVTLIPFAGIAFLWFMGVIRAQLGRREDQFFATVFLGSGLLFLGGLFVWVAVIAAVLASADADPNDWASSSAFIFGGSMIKVIGVVVALRMGGVFMFSTATIWLRTKAMPRWLVGLSYVLALVLIFGGPSVRILNLAFPVWVLVVSVLVLRLQRITHTDDEL